MKLSNVVGVNSLIVFLQLCVETKSSSWYDPCGFRVVFGNSLIRINSTGEVVNATNLPGFGCQASATPGWSLPSIPTFVSNPIPAPTLGFTTGGAMGIENFRRSIEEDVLPSPLDLTYEGIFNEYFFDTKDENNNSSTCNQLFCPDYSVGISADPLSENMEMDLYLSVGLDSGLAVTSFLRRFLNIVIVLDISGSMDQLFYTETDYDPQKLENEFSSKLEVAKFAIQDMFQQLNLNDSLAIVVFSDFAEVLVELTSLEQLDFLDISEKINELQTEGGTNMEAGYQMASDVLRQCQDCIFDKRYDNRIIFLTDAQPNTGDTSALGLSSQVKKNSGNSIFTTFIGIGLDFNTELSEILTKTRGANYFVVSSPEEFRKKLDDEFDFMVTPLVFDIKLEIDEESFNDGNGWKVIKVYGSPDVDGGLDKNGTFIEVNTLFPSPKTEEGIKGGIILLKMQKPKLEIPLKLKVSYKDRNNLQKYESYSEVDQFGELQDDEYFESSGIQKAVLLARYVDLIRGWLIDQRYYNNNSTQVARQAQTVNYSPPNPLSSTADIESQQQQNFVETVKISKNLCDYYPADRVVDEDNQCLIQSFIQPKTSILPVFNSIFEGNKDIWSKSNKQGLKVSLSQGEAMEQFLIYFQDSIDELGDETLEQEIAILIKLIEISGYV